MQGRNLEAGTKTETMEEGCLLVYSSWLDHPVFYTIQNYPHPSDVGPPTLIIN